MVLRSSVSTFVRNYGLKGFYSSIKDLFAPYHGLPAFAIHSVIRAHLKSGKDERLLT